MSPFLRAFTEDFESGVRHRGRDYFRRRAAKIISASPGELLARVQGTGGTYDVNVTFDPADSEEPPEYDCTCRYFQDHGGEPCKHLWAALLQADAEGTLPADVLPAEPQPEEDDDFNEVEDDDVGYGDPRPAIGFGRPGLPPLVRGSQLSKGGKAPGKGAEKPDAWKRQFDVIRDSMRHAEAAYAETGPGGAAAGVAAWPPGKRILYVVDAQATLEGAGLTIELYSQGLKRDGSADRPKQLKIGREQVASLPDAADRHILQMLLGAHRSDWGYYYYDNDVSRRFVLPTAAYNDTFRAICQTGRCRIRTHAGDADALAPVEWDDGEPWQFWLEVKPSPGGRYLVVEGSFRRGGDAERQEMSQPTLLVAGGLIFAGGRVARLEHFGSFQLIVALRMGTKLSVPIDQRDELLRRLLALPRLPKLDLPEDLRFEESRPVPRPRLVIKKPTGRAYDDRLVGTLSFDYAGQIVDANHEGQAITVAPAQASPGTAAPGNGDGQTPPAAEAPPQHDARIVIYRDPQREAEHRARLIQIGFREAYDYYSTKNQHALRLAPNKLPKAVAELTAEGWMIEAEGKLYRQAGNFNVQVKSGIDWFELHGDVSFGDNLSAPLPRLLAALRRGERTIVLDDGSLGMLPDEWLKKYAALAGLGEVEGEHLKFTKRQVGFLDALLSSMPEARFDETFGRARDELMRFEGIRPLDPPTTFVGTLRAYQRDGLGWMQFLRTFGFGGCLADDMGLGKTVQVLALLEERRKLRAKPVTGGNGSSNGNGADGAHDIPCAPSLVVVPRSLVFNWIEEAKRFTPELRVLDHTHAQRLKAAEHFADYDLVLTTYGTLRRDAAYFKDVTFDYVVLDEAQAIKNPSSESAKATRLLRTDHRLALSGTPVQNHLGELWSLFDFLNPGMMGAASVFRSIGAGAGVNVAPEARQLLSRALRPFILRRTKEQVAKDLPEKTEQTLHCELDTEQRKLYDELREHYRTSLLERVAREGMNKAKIQILEALLRLRQAACHPGLIDKARVKEGSAKLNSLVEQVAEVIDGGHKVLVFSQFTSFLAIVRDRFDKAKTVYEYLDGKTRDRQARVNRFQNDPDCKLFLISLKAGGLGLNLTAAEYVFLLDPWWNPAVEAQAIDRAHRIGQTRQVFAYRLIAKDTVEEKVLQLQQSKRDLADAIINADNSLIRKLGREDLELLLS